MLYNYVNSLKQISNYYCSLKACTTKNRRFYGRGFVGVKTARPYSRVRSAS